MSVYDIVAEIPRLTVEERLIVLDAITQSLRTDMAPQQQIEASLVDRLYGAFKTDAPAPTDAELDRIRFEELMEKHS